MMCRAQGGLCTEDEGVARSADVRSQECVAAHFVLFLGPLWMRSQQHRHHRLRRFALLHRSDVQRQSPILYIHVAGDYGALT